MQLGLNSAASCPEKNGRSRWRRGDDGVGQNPLEVTQAVKEKFASSIGIAPGRPHRPLLRCTRLIDRRFTPSPPRGENHHRPIAILLILTHLRSAIVVCITLPMAVHFSCSCTTSTSPATSCPSAASPSASESVDGLSSWSKNASHERSSTSATRNHGDTSEIVIRSAPRGRPIFSGRDMCPVHPALPSAARKETFPPSRLHHGYVRRGYPPSPSPRADSLLIRGRIKGEEDNGSSAASSTFACISLMIAHRFVLWSWPPYCCWPAVFSASPG